MKDSTLMHNKLVRSSLKQFEGYEVAFLREGNLLEFSLPWAMVPTFT